MKNYMVVMASDEFGGEEFPAESLAEAYATAARLATKSRKLNDGILRNFYISEIIAKRYGI